MDDLTAATNLGGLGMLPVLAYAVLRLTSAATDAVTGLKAHWARLATHDAKVLEHEDKMLELVTVGVTMLAERDERDAAGEKRREDRTTERLARRSAEHLG